MNARVCFRSSMLGCAAMALLAVAAVPASAQVMDFFCSTLTIGCEPPPPSPPPPAPVVEAPAPEPMKKVAHKKVKPKKVAAKVEKKTPAPAEAAEPAAK